MFYRFPNEAAPVSKADCLALRQADVVSFHHFNEKSHISVTKKESENNPFESIIIHPLPEVQK